jgi:fermentation-respiration switch protein FrsA (DUF1100 family)
MTLVWGLPALYLVISLVLWAFQEKITFPAPRGPLPDPKAALGYGERIELRMRDGTKLVGWYLPPLRRTSSPSAALLWFYGNGETIGAIWPILRDFRPPHAALLVLDYPGYGASGGKATEAGLYEAADLGYATLAARDGVDRTRIYAYGRSLGSAAATYTAAHHDVAGLILESPFTSARGMAARHYKIFPRFLVRMKLDNLATIPQVRCPVLVFHGTADMLVPMHMGKAVAGAAAGPVEFVMIEGAGHNDTYYMGGASYRQKLAAFVR